MSKRIKACNIFRKQFVKLLFRPQNAVDGLRGRTLDAAHWNQVLIYVLILDLAIAPQGIINSIPVIFRLRRALQLNRAVTVVRLPDKRNYRLSRTEQPASATIYQPLAVALA